jgi:hypothetical protein
LSDDGNTLTFDDAGDADPSFAIPKLTSATNPLVGGWALINGDWSNDTGNNIYVLTFLDDTNFVFLKKGTTDAEGQTGMERGTYSWARDSDTFSANVVVDTNGGWGLSDPAPGVTIALSGDTLVYEDGVDITGGGTLDVLTLTRVE